MAVKLSLEIVSPERPVAQQDVDFVVLPAVDGEIGILSGHTHLLTVLGVGELRITASGQVSTFAVSGGFAEVHPNRVSVFAEAAEMATEIDTERARLAAERAKQEISQAASPEDLSLAQAALRRALLRLHVSEGISRRQRPK
jgi:F-type H+-transporting ATPase subunit epsilon